MKTQLIAIKLQMKYLKLNCVNFTWPIYIIENLLNTYHNH